MMEYYFRKIDAYDMIIYQSNSNYGMNHETPLTLFFSPYLYWEKKRKDITFDTFCDSPFKDPGRQTYL